MIDIVHYHGDDNKADIRFNLAVTEVGNGSGIIDHSFDSTGATDESRLLWLHLRNSGLIVGNNNDSSQPINVFSGIVGVSSDTQINGGIAANTIRGLFVGFTQIPEDVALILDTRNDDGLTQSGDIQSNQLDYTTNNLHSIFFGL